MADTLAPWLLDYALLIAKTYGANIANVPSHPKGKKVQLTEFLTYNTGEAEDSLLWAQISDKQYMIPVKFTKNAMPQYAQQNPSRRFTQHKTAVITIKNFKLIFTRVPLGIPGTVTTEPSLAVECLSFSVLGSSGEAIFGNPKSITDHPELHQWSKCLERDGGAANFLKDRKTRQELNDSAGVVQAPTTLPERPRSPIFKRTIAQPMPCAQDSSSIAAYMNKWQFVERNKEYRRLPQTINAPPSGTDNKPTLVSDLETGDAPSNAQQCPLPNPPEVPLTEPDSSNIAFSSSIPAPTRAQRTKRSDILDQQSYLGYGPLSSNSDDLMAQSVSRKIPRPSSPVPHDHKDPVRVLAPNSDAGSSQPISQSQYQLQSQLRPVSDHGQDESTIDHKDDSQALLLGITIDLTAGDYPFFDLLRVREILERTYRFR